MQINLVQMLLWLVKFDFFHLLTSDYAAQIQALQEQQQAQYTTAYNWAHAGYYPNNFQQPYTQWTGSVDYYNVQMQNAAITMQNQLQQCPGYWW